jgi:hypothetical protein
VGDQPGSLIGLQGCVNVAVENMKRSALAFGVAIQSVALAGLPGTGLAGDPDINITEIKAIETMILGAPLTAREVADCLMEAGSTSELA